MNMEVEMVNSAFIETLKKKETYEILAYISKFNEKIDYYTKMLHDEEFMLKKGMNAVAVTRQICLTEEKKALCVKEIESRQGLTL